MLCNICGHDMELHLHQKSGGPCTSPGCECCGLFVPPGDGATYAPVVDELATVRAEIEDLCNQLSEARKVETTLLMERQKFRGM